MYGRVKIEIVSGLYEEFLNYLIENEFRISSIKSTDFGVTLVCDAVDYKKIAKNARRYQCRTKVLHRKGVMFRIKKLIPRKSVTVAVFSVFVYIFLFSKLIWRIDVISPDQRINNSIYNLLYHNDIYAGSVFSQQKNQDIIQNIFTDVENVGYVTLNFYKGVLTCKVDPTVDKKQYMQNAVTGNIVAAQNGVIEDLRVYSGFSQVKPGQTVTKGEILVSATYIDRNGNLQQVMPRAYIKAACVKKYTTQVELDKKVYIRTGESRTEKELKIPGRKIKIKRCDLTGYNNYNTEKKYSYIDFCGFRLPATIEKTTHYITEQINIKKDEKTAVNAAKKIIGTLIESDISLETADAAEYS